MEKKNHCHMYKIACLEQVEINAKSEKVTIQIMLALVDMRVSQLSVQLVSIRREDFYSSKRLVKYSKENI